MTALIPNISSNTNTFSDWLSSFDTMVALFSSNVVTADSTANGSLTTGNVQINGGLYSNNISTYLISGGPLSVNTWSNILLTSNNLSFVISNTTQAVISNTGLVITSKLTANSLVISNTFSVNSSAVFFGTTFTVANAVSGNQPVNLNQLNSVSMTLTNSINANVEMLENNINAISTVATTTAAAVGSFSNTIIINTNGLNSLNFLASAIGSFVYLYGSGGVTISIPQASSVPLGSTYTIDNDTGGGINFVCSSTTFYIIQTGQATISSANYSSTINSRTIVKLISGSNGAWYIMIT